MEKALDLDGSIVTQQYYKHSSPVGSFGETSRQFMQIRRSLAVWSLVYLCNWVACFKEEIEHFLGIKSLSSCFQRPLWCNPQVFSLELRSALVGEPITIGKPLGRTYSKQGEQVLQQTLPSKILLPLHTAGCSIRLLKMTHDMLGLLPFHRREQLL